MYDRVHLKNLLNNYKCLMFRKQRKILVHHNPSISLENVNVQACLGVSMAQIATFIYHLKKINLSTFYSS